MDSDLKIGNNSTKGLYIGDKEIMGGGRKQLSIIYTKIVYLLKF